MKEKTKAKIVFVAIILMALTFRVVGLEKNPPALNWDEVSHGYNAYSILKTGKDEWGRVFPTIFRAYGDYKLPVYIYATTIFEAFLGVSSLSVRLPSILAGTGIVILTYLLVKHLFNNKCLALISSFLVSVAPWSLFLSRAAFEANLAVFFILFGIYLFLKGLKKPSMLILSSIFFGLSVWTYNSARVFVPLFLVALLIIYKKRVLTIFRAGRSKIYMPVIVLLVFFIPMLVQLVNPEGQARYGWVTILDEGAISQINEARTRSDFSPTISRLVSNKLTFFTKAFFLNYFSHFDFRYLFTEGGSDYQLSVPGFGVLHPINIPFILLGAVFLLRRRRREDILILSWLALSPIASSITREAPHVLRSSVMLPIPMILSAYGLIVAVKNLNKSWRQGALLIYVVVVFALLGRYWNHYSSDYRVSYSWSWQYGYKEVVDYAKENYDDYEKIVVTKKYGEPHEFFLFYWPWNPGLYRNDSNLVRFNQSNWYWVDSFDKLYFVNDWQINEEGAGSKRFNLESRGIVDCTASSCLLVTSPGNVPNGWVKLETIDFLDGKSAFEIYEN